MDAPALWIAVIAAATVVMAIVQVGVVVYGARVAQRVNRLLDVVEREVRPALGRVDRISADAERVTKAAAAQVDRVDRIVGRVADQAEDLLAMTRTSVVTPVHRGNAFLAGLRAALETFRRPDEAPPERTDEPARPASNDSAVSAG